MGVPTSQHRLHCRSSVVVYYDFMNHLLDLCEWVAWIGIGVGMIQIYQDFGLRHYRQ